MATRNNFFVRVKITIEVHGRVDAFLTFLVWKAYGLVDLNCKRVYAVKVVIWNTAKVSAAVGYLPLDLYGEVSEVKKNQPATEKFVLPGMCTLLASA